MDSDGDVVDLRRTFPEFLIHMSLLHVMSPDEPERCEAVRANHDTAQFG